MTGPSPEVRAAVIGRAMSRCEVCGGSLDIGSIHHRRPRKMGGSRTDWINSPENLLALCGTGVTGCHGWIERNRAAALDRGWLLTADLIPWETPVSDGHGDWWMLEADRKTRITLPFKNPALPIVTRSGVDWIEPSAKKGRR